MTAAVTRGPRFLPIMSIREAFRVLKAGKYRVDIETGTLFGRGNRPVKPFTSHGYEFIRLYDVDKVKTIGVARLVWIVATGCEVPGQFEIHHWDRDRKNNAFGNLLCVHKLDHKKLHALDDDEVPF